MALERKSVTKPEAHPFEVLSASKTAESETAPQTGENITSTSHAGTHQDPLVPRTYRIPQTYDARLQRGALLLGLQRGVATTKSDIVREAVDEYLTRHELT